MNRIASDEPDVLTFAPKPIEFWFRGRRYEAAVSRSGMSRDRIVRTYGGWPYELAGEHGRAWLADPCSMILDASIHAMRCDQDAQARADRAARRKAKEKLLEEEAAARRQKASRW